MKRKVLMALRDGIKVMGGAWLTGVAMTVLMTWQWNLTAAHPAPIGWIAGIAAVAAIPVSLLTLALYALFRARLQRGCRPWHMLCALAASMLLFRLTSGMYMQGAGGDTLIFWMMGAHWLLLLLACLGVVHIALNRSGRIRHVQG